MKIHHTITERATAAIAIAAATANIQLQRQLATQRQEEDRKRERMCVCIIKWRIHRNHGMKNQWKTMHDFVDLCVIHGAIYALCIHQTGQRPIQQNSIEPTTIRSTIDIQHTAHSVRTPCITSSIPFSLLVTQLESTQKISFCRGILCEFFTLLQFLFFVYLCLFRVDFIHDLAPAFVVPV